MITAYDALFASIFDEKVDMILVGDSLNMSFFGQNDTLSASLEQMIYHTKAVCTGAKNTFVVADIPFGSYQNKKQALKNATKIFKQTKADAVKIEGGMERADLVAHLCQNSIAVVGHIGLMPQFVRSEGGYKIKGKSEAEEKRLIQDAKALEKAGVFCIVLEGIKPLVAEKITKSLSVPTIGIGSGNKTDGQVLVWSDAFGFYDTFKPKFVRQFMQGKDLVQKALAEYVKAVEEGTFPNESESY